jgi:Xaa-Pro aminopeptidase
MTSVNRGTDDEQRVSVNDMGGNIHEYGSTAVDFEQRVTFNRLRSYRLARTREALRRSELGALLCFDVNNVRYITSTAIGEWSRDKYVRYSLLTRDGEPYIWDFGSAAVHHRLYAPWISPEKSIGAFSTLRGAVPPGARITEQLVDEIKDLLRDAGVDGEPVGVDTSDTATFLALQAAGLDVRDGQQVMLDAREIKSTDEILLLSHAAAMVDGAYQEVAEALKPGIRENEIVALVNEYLYARGSDDVESVNAVSGERCIPHPHNFSDRIIRPGDLAFFDVMHAFNGYRTCYYRCFAVGKATQAQEDAYRRAREWIDAAIELVKPGVTTDQIARLWPTAQEIGLAGEREAFGLQFGHGLGLALHERPIISRLNSLENPSEIKEGMVFALETYCPATDGYSGARIEEEVVVTRDGPRVITRFPSQTLFVTHEY